MDTVVYSKYVELKENVDINLYGLVFIYVCRMTHEEKQHIHTKIKHKIVHKMTFKVDLIR